MRSACQNGVDAPSWRGAGLTKDQWLELVYMEAKVLDRKWDGVGESEWLA